MASSAIARAFPLDFQVLGLHLGDHGLASDESGMTYDPSGIPGGSSVSSPMGGAVTPASAYVTPPASAIQPSVAAAQAADQQSPAQALAGGDITSYLTGSGFSQDAGTGIWSAPGQTFQQTVGGAPGENQGFFTNQAGQWSFNPNIWDPTATGGRGYVVGPGGQVPAGVDPSQVVQLQPGQAAMQVNGAYVAYNPTDPGDPYNYSTQSGYVIPGGSAAGGQSGLPPGYQNYLPGNL